MYGQRRVSVDGGSSTPVQVDIRLICATNRDLEKMVQEGSFHQDLYFRISVFRIDLPALRDRRDDIPLLAEYFCRHFADLHKKDVHGLTPGYVSALVRHDWPGNVRELQNVIERSLILSDGPQLAVQDLPPEFKTLVISTPIPSGSFHDALRHFKREMILGALRSTTGNRQKAARELHKVGVQVLAQTCDVRSPDSVDYLFALVRELRTPLDILINKRTSLTGSEDERKKRKRLCRRASLLSRG